MKIERNIPLSRAFSRLPFHVCRFTFHDLGLPTADLQAEDLTKAYSLFTIDHSPKKNPSSLNRQGLYGFFAFVIYAE